MFEVSFLLQHVNFMVMQMPSPELLQELHEKTFVLLDRCFPDTNARNAVLNKLSALFGSAIAIANCHA